MYSEVVGLILKDLELELSNIEYITNNSTESEESNLINSYYQIKENIDKLNKKITLSKIDRDKVNNDIIELENTSKTSSINISKLERELKENE